MYFSCFTEIIISIFHFKLQCPYSFTRVYSGGKNREKKDVVKKITARMGKNILERLPGIIVSFGISDRSHR